MLNQAELENLTTVERLHFHLIAPKEFEVGQRDLDYLENLRAAWGIANEHQIRYEQVKLTAEALMVTERQARNVLDDAQLLFAPIYESNEEIDKKFLTEYYLRIARKAEEGGFFDSAKAALDSIAKLNGFFDKELPIKPGDLNIPTIVLTSDPKALNTEKIEEADVIE